MNEKTFMFLTIDELPQAARFSFAVSFLLGIIPAIVLFVTMTLLLFVPNGINMEMGKNWIFIVTLFIVFSITAAIIGFTFKIIHRKVVTEC